MISRDLLFVCLQSRNQIQRGRRLGNRDNDSDISSHLMGEGVSPPGGSKLVNGEKSGEDMVLLFFCTRS